MCRQSSAISHSEPALVRLQMAWRTLYPAGSCFAPHFRDGKQQQAGFELWVTLWARTHPPPTPSYPCQAPLGAKRPDTSWNNIKKHFPHRSRGRKIAPGLCLSSLEMLVFAAMDALYGGACKPLATFTRVARVVPLTLLCIQYMVTPPPTVFGQPILFTKIEDQICQLGLAWLTDNLNFALVRHSVKRKWKLIWNHNCHLASLLFGN